MSTIKFAALLIHAFLRGHLVDNIASRSPYIRRILGLYPFSAEPPLAEYFYKLTTHSPNKTNETHQLTRAHPTSSLVGSLLICLLQVVKAIFLLIEQIFRPLRTVPTKISKGAVFKALKEYLKYAPADNEQQEPDKMDTESDTYTAPAAANHNIPFNQDDSIVDPTQLAYHVPSQPFLTYPDYVLFDDNSPSTNSISLFDPLESPVDSFGSLPPNYDSPTANSMEFDYEASSNSPGSLQFGYDSPFDNFMQYNYVSPEASVNSPDCLIFNYNSPVTNIMQFDYASPEASVNSPGYPLIPDEHATVGMQPSSHVLPYGGVLYSGISVSDESVHGENTYGINPSQFPIAPYQDTIFGFGTHSFEDPALANINISESPLSQASEGDYHIVSSTTPFAQSEGLPTPALSPDCNSPSPSSSPLQLGFALYPHSCSECHSVFRRRCDLTKHFKTVHLKDFPCKWCPKKFSASRDLRRHIDGVHLRKKDHFCELCAQQGVEKKLSRADNLKVHLRKVHKLGS